MKGKHNLSKINDYFKKHPRAHYDRELGRMIYYERKEE